jgi:predicted nuclease with TOPRIM domain
MALHRQGFLLFHPDHYQFGRPVEHLAPYWHEVFVRYKQRTALVIAELDQAQATLEKYIAPRREREREAMELRKFFKDLHEELKELKESKERSYEHFKIWHAEMKEIKEETQLQKEKLKELEETSQLRVAKFKAEIEEKLNAEMEERLKLQEAKIEQLQQFLLSSARLAEQSVDKAKEPTAANESANGQRFFKP